MSDMDRLIGSEMTLQEILDIKKPETILTFKEIEWGFKTMEKLIGFIHNENVSREDKVKAFMYLAPLIGVNCTDEAHAIRQIEIEEKCEF